MTVKKGLTSLVNSSPNFSNQGLENSINDIKAIDKDDGHSFVKSQFLLDTAIYNNTVLTTSQKNDVLDAIYNAEPHLQIGRYLNDTIRHTNTILDGTILGIVEGITDFPQGDFLEIMQLVLSLQTTIPDLYGVPASAKSRSVNDHLGLLNNMFARTEDSTAPVFTRLKEIVQKIDRTSRANTVSGLNLAITNAAVGNLNLRTFLNGLVADSTDFQQSLDNMVTLCTNKYSTLHTRISEIPGDPTIELISIRDKIVTQQSLENSNITSLRTFTDTQSNYQAYISLADNEDFRKFLARVAQDSNWKNYFETYSQNQSNINSRYTSANDSDKSSIIDQVLAEIGLPDVLDGTNFKAVADKSERDDRIDTKGYDQLTDEQRITRSCQQVGLETANRTILDQSQRLLTNMDQHDRQKIATELDLNEASSTLT